MRSPGGASARHLEIAPFIAGKGVAGAGGESLELASSLFSLVGSWSARF